MANINDLEALVPVKEMSELDQWILSVAHEVFAEIHKSFSAYNFVHGMSLLNNFIVNELSGIYLDITKDRLYCDGAQELHRAASQSAMAMITKSMLLLVAPILTYTADEIVENLPKIIKGDAQDIFDLTFENIEAIESSFNAVYMSEAREGFYEIVDKLKKEKLIKSTLELVISTKSATTLAINATEAEDWFVVSEVSNKELSEFLGTFKVGEDTFTIAKATMAKCPRCWKFQSTSEECTCERCAKVVNA
jgi:isoleucyl-tRNA synthetase